jgi:hypothetical protein
MLRFSDAHHFRKTVAGICMFLAPVLFVIASIVAPSSDNDAAAILGATADHADRFYISTVLAIAGAVFLLPALLGLMHMLREKRVAFGHVGGGLALLGNLMLMLLLGGSLMQWQMVRGGADRIEMVSLIDRYMDTAGSSLFFFFTLALTVGMIVLAAGLYLARAVHWSTAGALTAGAVLLQIAFFVGNTAGWYIVASAVLLVGFATIGRMVLMETDEEWEHTPEFRGFRPAAMH